MNKLRTVELGVTVFMVAHVVVVVLGIESLPRYMLQYLLRAGLAYQGY